MKRYPGKTCIASLLIAFFVFPLFAVKFKIIDAVRSNKHAPLALFAVVSNVQYNAEEGILKYNCFELSRFKKYSAGYLWKRSNKTVFFDKTIWERFVESSSHPAAYAPWLLKMEKYSALSNTTKLVLKQLYDLSNRLEILHKSRRQITRMFADAKTAIPLDKDIKYLSELGWRLVTATRSFFQSSKKTMINLEIVSARHQALEGLKSLNQDIEKIRTMQLKAVDESIDMVVEAMKNLEKAVNR